MYVGKSGFLKPELAGRLLHACVRTKKRKKMVHSSGDPLSVQGKRNPPRTCLHLDYCKGKKNASFPSRVLKHATGDVNGEGESLSGASHKPLTII